MIWGWGVEMVGGFSIGLVSLTRGCGCGGSGGGMSCTIARGSPLTSVLCFSFREWTGERGGAMGLSRDGSGFSRCL